MKDSRSNEGASISPFQIAWEKGRRAAWENRYAGICLWLFGVIIIGGYYWIHSVHDALERLGEWKAEAGLQFSVVSTAIFGGVIPVVLPRLLGLKVKKGFWLLLVSNGIFWALKGVEVDLFYRLQAYLFGDDTSPMTILLKVIVDQAIYAPTVGLLNCVLFYIWRDNQFRLAPTRKALGENWYPRRVLPALISNWFVWCPATVIIYSLPLALQLPVQNLILCFWVLVLELFTQADEPSE